MDHKPIIAIYMSCYNHEKYVAEAMESILSQTYPHWELFVANDGSTDRTGEILCQYDDSRIHYYDLKKNTKLAGAMELLIDEIRPLFFDYVQSMASDDLWDKRKLERQIDFMETHPQYAACFTWDKVIFSDGADDYPQDYSHVKNRSRYNWARRFYQYGNCLNANSALIRKNVYYEMETMNPRFFGTNDFRLWFMIAAKYPVYLIQEDLTFYRRHPDNISNITLETALGFYSEVSRTRYDVIQSMQQTDFRRTFYSFLTYKRCETEAELLAEKFMVLLNRAEPDSDHAAIWFYYDHCLDRSFTGCLKERYGFDNSEFTFFKERAGLQYAANHIARNAGIDVFFPQEARRLFTPGKRLLDDLKCNRINATSIRTYTYAALWSFYEEQQARLADDNETIAFQTMKRVLHEARVTWRNSLTVRKVLFLVAADSGWCLTAENTPISPDENVVFYVSYVAKEDVCQKPDMSDVTDRRLHNDGSTIPFQSINLFDEKNQALRFAEEEIESLTDICYVDCMNADYECYDMLLGFSLGCSQVAIMDFDMYNYMIQEDQQMMQMLDGVYHYE